MSKYVDLGSLNETEHGFSINLNPKVIIAVNGEAILPSKNGKLYLNAQTVSDTITFLNEKGNSKAAFIVESAHSAPDELRVTAKLKSGTVTLGKIFKSLTGNHVFQLFKGVELTLNGQSYNNSFMSMESNEAKLNKVLKGDEVAIAERLAKTSFVKAHITAYMG